MTPIEKVLNEVVKETLIALTSQDAYEKFIKSKAQEILALIPEDSRITEYDHTYDHCEGCEKQGRNQGFAEVRRAMGG